MTRSQTVIAISYNASRVRGVLHVLETGATSIWERIVQRALAIETDYDLALGRLDVPWVTVLSLIREFAPLQRSDGFTFRPDAEARPKIEQFSREYKAVKAGRGQLTLKVSPAEIGARLAELGFTKRILTDFQTRDLSHLLVLSNGANFSVPGAGKTTVTFALHLLTKQAGQHLLVVGPKNAFVAWQDAVRDCMGADARDNGAEGFTVLSGGGETIAPLLNSGATRFLITYDQLVRVTGIVSAYLARRPVHLVLDESHRMKAGMSSLRGSTLLNVSSLPVRRDILSGTPMPQSPSDLQSQLDFLWPGSGLGWQIGQGAAPRSVLGNLYVRTTKSELGLDKPKRHFIHSAMLPGQQALYSIVRSEALKQLSSLKAESRIDVYKARRSVMTLLQLSANPVAALKAIAEDGNIAAVASGIIDKVVEEGVSQKVLDVADFARRLAKQGKKTVIWTIFTDTILQLEKLLVDQNPVSLYGAIPTGEDVDTDTRENRIKRFHDDPACSVMIANPAAAGEGISLHKACHDAIYLDRSYNTTHYLQSIDRIHRLGLPRGTETNIYIFQTVTPGIAGSIDYSVNRRLAKKLRNLQQLLDDPDLHEVALDEESAIDPSNYGIELDDLVDLVAELEGKEPLFSEEES